MNTREAIYSALFTLVSGSASFVTASRRLRMWDQVSQAEKPALFMSQRREIATRQPGGLGTIWELHVDLVVYVQTNPDIATAPATLLNPLIDAIQNALVPTGADRSQNRQTLGGIVQYARIEGDIQLDEGVLGDQGVAVIPVVIVTA